MAQETLLADLSNVGFTKYEARAYLCLLHMGPQTAPAVAKNGEVPKSKVYDILKKLLRRGIVEEFPGTPRKFRARQLDYFFDDMLQNNRTRLAEMEKVAARLKSTLLDIKAAAQIPLPHKPQIDRTEVLWTVSGKRGFHEKFVEMGAAAKNEILVMSPTFSRNPLLEHGLLDAKRRGVTIKGITMLTKENSPRIRYWLRHFTQIRHFPGGIPLTVLVFDDAHAIYRLSYESRGEINHIGVFSSNAQFIAAMRQYWDALWRVSRAITPLRLKNALSKSNLH